MPETKMTLLIKRSFKAPREELFAAWTQADTLQKWWGPEGFTAPSVEMDLKVGGKYRVEMQPSGFPRRNPTRKGLLKNPSSGAWPLPP